MSNRGNNKVPLVAMYSRRKNLEKTPQKNINSASNSESNGRKISKHSYNTRSNKEEIKDIELDNSEDYGNKEYTKTVVEALKTSIDENTRLLKENEEMREKIKELKEENELKENAMLELYNIYEFCKKNHANSSVSNNLNPKNLRSKYKKQDSDSN